MKKTVIFCDHCNTRTDDLYAEKGWITLSGNKLYDGDGVTFSVSKGRDKVNQAVTGFKQTPDPVHFCGKNCLINYIEKL